MKKAVIYCRKSTAGKSTSHMGLQELTITSQQNICLEYCQKNNLEVLEIVNEIISARNMTKMTELHNLIDRLPDGTFLIVSDISRFSRNIIQGLEILESLKDKNIYIHAVCSNCTYDDISYNKYQFRSHLNQAEFESDQISDRIKRSLETRRKNRCKIGKSRFGYECYYDVHGLRRERLNKKEQYIHRLIESMNKDGLSTIDIAKILNNSGYTFRNKEWTNMRVRYVLRMSKKLVVRVNSSSL